MATSILVLVYRANLARDLEPISAFAHLAHCFVIFLFDSSRDAITALKDVNRVLCLKKELYNDASNFVKLETVYAIEKDAFTWSIRPR